MAEKHLLEVARGDRPLAVELLTPLSEDSKPNREDATHALIQGDAVTLGGQAQPMPGEVSPLRRSPCLDEQ
jgi:hypothetical protein